MGPAAENNNNPSPIADGFSGQLGGIRRMCVSPLRPPGRTVARENPSHRDEPTHRRLKAAQKQSKQGPRREAVAILCSFSQDQRKKAALRGEPCGGFATRCLCWNAGFVHFFTRPRFELAPSRGLVGSRTPDAPLLSSVYCARFNPHTPAGSTEKTGILVIFFGPGGLRPSVSPIRPQAGPPTAVPATQPPTSSAFPVETRRSGQHPYPPAEAESAGGSSSGRERLPLIAIPSRSCLS